MRSPGPRAISIAYHRIRVHTPGAKIGRGRSKRLGGFFATRAGLALLVGRGFRPFKRLRSAKCWVIGDELSG